MLNYCITNKAKHQNAKQYIPKRISLVILILFDWYNIVNLACIGSALLYLALHEFGIVLLIEKLYSASWDYNSTNRAQIYLLLINVPLIVLAFVSLIYNSSLTGFEISLNCDEINLFLVAGYICYVEQSRQTPINGFAFIRDIIFLIVCISVYLQLYAYGLISYQYIAILGSIYFVYITLQRNSEVIESKVLTLLGFREINIYNAKFLLTGRGSPCNFLQISDTIHERSDDIFEEVEDFRRIADKLTKNQEETVLLTNFAKLFIPIKKACQLNQEDNKRKIMEQYAKQWNEYIEENEETKGDLEEEEHVDEEDNDFIENSSITLNKMQRTDSDIVRQPITNDYANQHDEDDENNQEQVEESKVRKILQYCFYPLFWSMKIEGRLRNFVDYALVLMLLGCLFLLSNAFAFYSASLQSFQSGISLFGAILMSLPMARYYINLSAKKDGSCDYINIYLQSGIQKCGLFSIAVLIVYLQSSTFVAYPISFTVTLAIRLGTYIVFLIFMIAQKFAVRFSHFKIFIAIIVVSQSSRILTQIIMDSI